MPRDVTAVLAGLVGAADDDVLDLVGREAALGDHLADHAGEHVVRAHLGEGAGVPAERAARPVYI